ncbi:MAG: hypothetical protein AB7Q37_10395 [Pyrinomonadaceae bacterium]
MRTLKSTLQILLFLTIGLVDGDVFTQPTVNDRLTDRVKNVSFEGKSLTRIVSQIATEHQIPIGIEIVPPVQDLKLSFSVEDGTLKDLLNLVASSVPNYEWEIADDVINFLPTSRHETILQAIVSQYETKERNGLVLRQSITDLPEVRRAMKEQRIKPFHLSSGPLNGMIMPDNFAMRLKDVTVRTILNEIAKRSSNKYWVIGRDGKKKESLFVYL